MVYLEEQPQRRHEVVFLNAAGVDNLGVAVVFHPQDGDAAVVILQRAGHVRRGEDYQPEVWSRYQDVFKKAE